MPTPGLLYPGAPPTVNGNKVTVEWLMKHPTVIRKMLADITLERFIGDFIFAGGDAQGGAVVYDQITENDLYMDGDPQDIAPGDEFPLVNESAPDPKTDAVIKRGSAFIVTYENVRRNQMDVVQRGLVKLRNTSLKKHDALSMAKLHGEPLIPSTVAALDWNDPTADVFVDMNTARSTVENNDLGYSVDTAILHPNQELQLLNRKDVRDALPRENAQLNPILAKQLANLCRIENWIVTNRQTAGTIDFVTKGIVGSIRDEVPFYTRVIDQPDRERWLVMAGRVSVPIITDPFAAYRLEGLE